MARNDHCWTDVVDPSELEIYQDFFKRDVRTVGDKPALLAIDLYEKVYAGGPLPVREVNRSHPGACGIHAYNAIEPTKRLFAANVTAIYEDSAQTALLSQRIADAAHLWWDAKAPDQAGLWQSTVRLGEQFFTEVTQHPVPVDMRAIHALKRSPLALDIYAWLSYRASYARRSSTIPWEALAGQFGADYTRLRDFKAAFLAELRKVVTVYPAAKLEEAKGGLLVHPSPTHIRQRLK